MTPAVAAVQLGYATDREGFVSHDNGSSMPQCRCFDRGHCWNAAPAFVSHGDGGMDDRAERKTGGMVHDAQRSPAMI